MDRQPTDNQQQGHRQGGPLRLPSVDCRSCKRKNPIVYFAPVTLDGSGTCLCFECVKARGWIDRNGNLKSGIEL